MEENGVAQGRSLNVAEWIGLILVLVGGLNWLLVGLFDYNLVAAIFGDGSTVARIVYVLVGLATLYVAAISPRLLSRK